jgi:hypothetical protein
MMMQITGDYYNFHLELAMDHYLTLTSLTFRAVNVMLMPRKIYRLCFNCTD